MQHAKSQTIGLFPLEVLTDTCLTPSPHWVDECVTWSCTHMLLDGRAWAETWQQILLLGTRFFTYSTHTSAMCLLGTRTGCQHVIVANEAGPQKVLVAWVGLLMFLSVKVTMLRAHKATYANRSSVKCTHDSQNNNSRFLTLGNTCTRIHKSYHRIFTQLQAKA